MSTVTLSGLYADLLDALQDSEYGFEESGELDDGVRASAKYTDFEDEFGWADIYELLYSGKPVNLNDYTAELVESTGGEGEGDTVTLVIRTSDASGDVQYWKKTGSYASYDGSYWYGTFKEVKPVVRPVKFYE